MTQFANPGDEVDFTLRFDNVGNQPIGNVTIVDDLTGRLESAGHGPVQPAGRLQHPAEREAARWCCGGKSPTL